MIPKELIQQWEKEASELYPTPYSGELKLYQLAANQRVFRDREYYIKGRTDQYLQMQAENERLKGLIEAAYRGMMTEFFESRDNDTDILTLVDENWNRYKQQHNL